MTVRPLDSLRWFRRRYDGVSGGAHVVRRALEEWKRGGAKRVYQHLLHASAAEARERAYARWMREIEPALFDAMGVRGPAGSISGPIRFSILVPMFKTPTVMLERCIASVRAQTYRHWQLVLIDDGSPGSHVEFLARRYAVQDARIRFKRLASNAGIAQATNAGLECADGEYVVFLDHDDELCACALASIARRIEADRSIDILYSDEDKIDASGRRFGASFKPGFSPHYLWTCNYICHLCVMRTSMVRDELGGLRRGYEGAQDYELILRATEKPRRIAHIPLVLYHWRSHAESTAGFGHAKPHAVEAGRKALEASMKRRGLHEAAVENGPFPLTYRVRPRLESTDRVDVVLIGNADSLENATSESSESAFARVLSDHPRVQRVDVVDDMEAPFDVERFLADSTSRWVLFLDADLQPTSQGWLERMLEAARQPMSGPVGARIASADGRVENAGWVLDRQAEIGRAVYRGAAPHDPGYLWALTMQRNVSYVSRSCMLIDREDARSALARLRAMSIQAPLDELTLAIGMVLAGGRVAVITPDVVMRRRRPRGREHTHALGDAHRALIRTGWSDEMLIANLASIEPTYASWL